MTWSRFLLAIALLVAIAAPTMADVPAVPPVLSGTYDAATVLLSWEPPPSWTGAFRVYENGVAVAETFATTYAAPVTGRIQVFQVAAINDTDEGTWSNPFTLTGGPLDCPLILVNVLPPGLSIDERCIPPIIFRGCTIRVERLEPPIGYTISDGCYPVAFWWYGPRLGGS